MGVKLSLSCALTVMAQATSVRKINERFAFKMETTPLGNEELAMHRAVRMVAEQPLQL